MTMGSSSSEGSVISAAAATTMARRFVAGAGAVDAKGKEMNGWSFRDAKLAAVPAERVPAALKW